MKDNPFSILEYDVVNSTMDEARRLIDLGCASNTMVLAYQQTGGRGRQNRQWSSPSGNLYASLIIDAVSANLLSQFSLLVGVILREAILEYGCVKIQCKWPNDILVDGKKIAGVLIEYYEGKLIIGIGVNLESYPQHALFPATCMRDHTENIPRPVELAHTFASLYQDMFCKWHEDGFDWIRMGWLKGAWKYKEEIKIRLQDGYVIGIFDAIENDGALVLKHSTGQLSRHYVGDLVEEVKNVADN